MLCPSSLTAVLFGRLATWFAVMLDAGLTPEDLQRSLDDPALRDRLLACWMIDDRPRSAGQGLVYDAATVSRILGITVTCRDAPPNASPGEIVLYYGGWTLKDLHACIPGPQNPIWPQDWHVAYGWTAAPGYYHLLLAVPDSNMKTWNAQLCHLDATLPGWQPAPVCVVATAVLLHLVATGENLLHGDFYRCREALPGGHRVGVDVLMNRIYVRGQHDASWNKSSWLAAARTTSSLAS